VRVLSRLKTGIKVTYPTDFTLFFGEQRMNVTSFLRILGGLDGTSLVLVRYFCKVDCSLNETRVVI
jgi:hypothetical protein